MFGVQKGAYASYPEAFGKTNYTNREIKLEEYLANNPHSKASVTALSHATMPVYNMGNHFIGNGVAIAKDLVLVSKHCVNGENGNLGHFGLGKVVFDGSYERDRLDFIILWVKGANFSPVTLDVVAGVGESIQMYFKPTFSYPYHLEMYVKPFESDYSGYAMRSDRASSKTDAGECGAPRMSLMNGYVHAIHQGESEGLKVNDIYSVLEQASKDNSHPQNEVAKQILQNIQVANLEMKGMEWSPLVLKQGDVYEEKARVNGEIPVTVTIVEKGKSKPKTITATFGYTEIGEGRGPRWITIHKKGTPNSQITYAISPNPHDNKAYNNDGQEGFYKTLAIEVGKYYLLNKNQYFSKGVINHLLGENYTLTIDE